MVFFKLYILYDVHMYIHLTRSAREKAWIFFDEYNEYHYITVRENLFLLLSCRNFVCRQINKTVSFVCISTYISVASIIKILILGVGILERSTVAGLKPKVLRGDPLFPTTNWEKVKSKLS